MKLVWSEEYRPKNLETFISNDKDTIRNLIKNPMSMPNLLFVSKRPGTGKTSLANVIRREIKCHKSDFLILNSSDDRKIEVIRGVVKDFAMSMRRDPKIPKIILMDESDGMLPASQNALRFLMEKYSSNCKFILTCNNEEKIIEPIRSRCVILRFKEIPKQKIGERLEFILKEEEVNLEAGVIDKIIEMHYPDMRSMINHLQEVGSKGSIKLEDIKTKMQLEDEFYAILKQGNPYQSRKFVIEKALDPESVLKRTLNNIIRDKELQEKFDKEVFKERIIEIYWIGAEINYRMISGADSEIQLLAFILKFIQTFR